MKNFSLFLLGFLCIFLNSNINASNYNKIDAMMAASSIFGTVFSDDDGDGVQDINEDGIIGVTITLIDANGNILDTITTNADGTYSFGDLLEGTYTVTVGNGPAGTTLTTQNSFTFNLVEEQDTTNINFGFRELTIDLELVKSIDTDFADVGDEFVYTITLTNQGFSNGTGIIVTDNLPVEVAFVTADGTYNDATGEWNVGDLAAGSTETLQITVEAIAPGDFCNIAQVSAADQPDVDSQPNNDDGDQSEDDEGNACMTVEELGSIGDGVWFDENCDGIQDTNEQVIPGVIVTITYPDGTTETTITDDNGFYIFEGLTPGDYNVTVGDGPDSTVLATSGIDDISLGANEDYLDADFGFANPSECDTIEGCLYNNMFQVVLGDNSGCILPTDTLDIDTLKIQFSGADDLTYTIDLTDGTSQYQLDSILSGIYDVSILNLDTANYVSYGSTSTVMLTDEDTANISFTICSIENDDCPFNQYYYHYIKCDSTFTITGPDLMPGVNYNWYESPDYNTIFDTGKDLIVEYTENSDLKIYKAVYALNGIEDTSCYGEYFVEYFSVSSINGIAFLDTNEDGEYNFAETLKEGIKIYLFNENSILIDSTSTNADGNYSFTCLPEGTYFVCSDIITEILTTPEFYVINAINTIPNTANFGCIDITNLTKCPDNSIIELPCDSILTLTAPYYEKDSNYINIYSWYDQADTSTVLYEGDKFTVPINLDSTITYTAVRTTNDQPDEICSMYTVTYLPCKNKCPCGFDVIDYVICHNDFEQYDVLISLDSKKEILITDNNNTDIKIGPVETQIISLGPFDTPNGFSYDIDFLGENCKETISKTFVDCQLTAVELLRFDGKAASNGNLIEWVTASENDIDAFILEYSKDGYNFEKIKEINTIGNSNIKQTYNQLHQITKSGTHYYKLSTKDHSGNIQSVSRIIEIERMGDLIELHLYPNPISDVLNLEIISAEEKEATIEIYNYLGEQILQQNFNINRDNNVKSIQTSKLISGNYFIKISTNDVSMIQKFIKY